MAGAGDLSSLEVRLTTRFSGLDPVAGRRDGLDGFWVPDPDSSVCIGAPESAAAVVAGFYRHKRDTVVVCGAAESRHSES